LQENDHQYLIVDYGESLLIKNVIFILANSDTMDKESPDNIRASIDSMVFTTIHILDQENREVHQCDVPNVQTYNLTIEDQTYSVNCGGTLGRKVKFETVMFGKSILILETWAQTLKPPPVGKFNL
jgi:hypothetical protein